MNHHDLLKTVHFDYPDAVPVIFHINLSCWDHYPRNELADLITAHPTLFPQGPPPYAEPGKPVPYPEWCIKGRPWEDPWGCIWETPVSGYIGAVTRHPLENLDDMESYEPPDPEHTTHWYPVSWKRGQSPTGGSIGFFDALRSGEIGHGHTFLKLTDILGYQQALFGLHDADPRVLQVISMLEQFNLGLVRRFIEYGDVQWLGYAEDLGMQIGPMISPQMFRDWILPVYRTIMEPAQRHGAVIHMHSDGDIRMLADDLLKLPVQVLNIQDQVNGIGWTAEHLKGRIAIDLDIDRQHITPSASPDQVRQYIISVMEGLYDPAGGLILTFGLYPGTPMENIKALMDIMEEISLGRTSWNS